MKIPVSWLKDYVDFEDSTQGLSDKLTFSGVEVEGIETVGLQVEGVVVAEVRSLEPHPDADRLTVCRVWNGTEELQVVCGAPNVRAGMKSAFAPVGTVLANGLKLKKAKIRGVASFGMLCADDEVGLSESHEGILDLAGDWEAGTPLADVVGEPETVLDLEITPNRPDCLSVIGIAREIAVLYGKPLNLPPVDYEEAAKPASEYAGVEVEDPGGCPRYTARVITDLEVRPSPPWMQKRLTLSGIRPINNLVDITNYVLLECGHPMHAFDHALLEGGRVVVRRARDGERITALDESEHKLDGEVLVIADAQRPVAIAGIMGGVGSEVMDATRTVLLESAVFHPPLVRATSRRLDLSSESSYRFERGTDVENADWASRRGAALMAELAGGKVAAGVIDVYPEPWKPRQVTCRWDRVRDLLGVDAGNDRMREVFLALGLTVAREDEQTCVLHIPSFRDDLQREVDLVEEFARMDGLDKIPSPAPHGQIVPDVDDEAPRATEACRTTLVGLGLHEAVHYSLVEDKLLDLFDRHDAPSRVVLPNPVSQDQSILRTSLIPQMVETLGRNRARQCASMACFEMGRVFHLRKGEAPAEEDRVCIGLMGPVGRQGPRAPAAVTPAEAFGWLKGLWESLTLAQKVGPWSIQAGDAPWMMPGHGVTLLLPGGVTGVLGLVKPEIPDTWRITEPVGVLEVPRSVLLASTGARQRVQPLTPYPSVTRDVALVVAQSVQHQQVVDVMRAAAPPELEDIALFDIFEGKGVGPGRKSMAYSLRYRSASGTLTDGDANQYHDVVKEALKAQLAAEIREH